MTLLLPLVALALALAAPFVLRGERARLDPARLGVLVLLVLLGAGVAFKAAPAADRTSAILGLALGAVVPLLGAWTGAFAAGVAGASALHLFPANPALGLAFVAGTGLGALALGGGEAAALAGVLVFAADDLGMRHSQLPASAFVGSQVGIALAVGALLPSLERGFAWRRPLLIGAILVAATPFLAHVEDYSGLRLCLLLGTVGGVVIHFLMPEEEGESSRVGLAAVIGVGLATVAFGLGRGAGMGLAALAAVGVLLAADNRRAVLALGPLVGLVLARVLREAGTGATRALDISQHYTLLALVFGLALPLLPTDWLRARTSAAGTFLWGVVALAAAPLLVVALGMRGGIGFVVGLGASGLVQALRAPSSFRRGTEATDDEHPHRDRNEEGVGGGDSGALHTPHSAPSLTPLSLGAGLAGSTILALAWLGDESVLSRGAKVHLFAYAAVGIAVIAGMLALAGRRKEEAK